MAEFEGIKKSYIDWKNLMPQEIQKQELVMGEFVALQFEIYSKSFIQNPICQLN
jgi:hypothetical protein